MMQRNNNNSSTTSSVQSACAACKHQRKKCSEDCKLARYFPANRSKEFQAVHKVFGVSNVTKIVQNANDEESRQKVVDSLIWEAFWRQKDPVSGPYGEYQRICEELKLYRSQTLMQNHNHRNQNHQLVQLPGQGGMIYRSSSQPLMGWNNGMNTNNGISVSGNEQLDYNNHDNGNNSIVDLDTYSFASHFVQSPKNLKQEREVGTVVIPLQQQQQQRQQPSINSGFSQQYYIPGKFS